MSESLEERLQNKPSEPEQSELGHSSNYDASYNPERLFPIARATKRQEIGVDPVNLPFKGFDCWNHYEVSWLNEKGKPMVAVAEIIYDCTTPYIIESKSMKLYFNSFNNTGFQDSEALRRIIERDLSVRVEGDVHVRILPLKEKELLMVHAAPKGKCLDDLDVTCTQYLVEPAYLSVEDKNVEVEEILYSDLLKSNCLVTNQPDWGSVQIAYTGRQIHHEGLLKYLVSFRNHNEFHEQCIERIFIDIMNHCQPEKLTVYGRYTRRGGLDINPYRTTKKNIPQGLNQRLVRQ
jgi:7-cyano-7-deazaguanine reductase